MSFKPEIMIMQKVYSRKTSDSAESPPDMWNQSAYLNTKKESKKRASKNKSPFKAKQTATVKKDLSPKKKNLDPVQDKSKHFLLNQIDDINNFVNQASNEVIK
jgi:hypothetical protein